MQNKKIDLIKTIKIDKANMLHIAETGKINGTLLLEIERVMDDYYKKVENWKSFADEEPDLNSLIIVKKHDGIIPKIFTWYYDFYINDIKRNGAIEWRYFSTKVKNK